MLPLECAQQLAYIPSSTVPVPSLLPRVLTCSFRVQPLDIDTLCAAVESMKTGPDDISMHMLHIFFLD